MLIIKKRLKTLIANILSLYLFSVPEAGSSHPNYETKSIDNQHLIFS